MSRAAVVEIKNVQAVPSISNEFSSGSERFEPVSRLIERFEQETERMLRKPKAA